MSRSSAGICGKPMMLEDIGSHYQTDACCTSSQKACREKPSFYIGNQMCAAASRVTRMIVDSGPRFAIIITIITITTITIHTLW